jgi:dolichol kinase
LCRISQQKRMTQAASNPVPFTDKKNHSAWNGIKLFFLHCLFVSKTFRIGNNIPLGLANATLSDSFTTILGKCVR